MGVKSLFMIGNYYLMAILASLFWGFGFVGSAWAVDALTPAWANGLRFFLSAMMMAPVLFFKSNKKISKKEILGALAASILLAAVMILQTMSLKYTTVSKCGFITILYVLITPLITYFLYKEKLSKTFIYSLLASMVGVAFLFELKLNNFNYGDGLALVSTIIFAGHLLLIDRIVKNSEINLLRFNFFQILFVGIICLTGAIFHDGFLNYGQLAFIFKTKYLGFIGIVSTALFSTTLAFFFQIKSQVKIKPHIIGLIFLTESAFAAIFGNIFLGEQLSFLSIIGCLVLFSSVSFIPLKENFNIDLSKAIKPTMMIFLFVLLSSFN